MEIVIEIPEEDYIRLRDEGMFGNVTTFKRAVREGTPLPKGHGALKDAEYLKSCFPDLRDGAGTYNRNIIELIDVAPTIIEADGGDAE